MNSYAWTWIGLQILNGQQKDLEELETKVVQRTDVLERQLQKDEKNSRWVGIKGGKFDDG